MDINEIFSFRYDFSKCEKDTSVNRSGMNAMFDISCDFWLTLFRMGLFGAAHGWGGPGAKRPPSLKSVTYPTMMKLGTVIP